MGTNQEMRYTKLMTEGRELNCSVYKFNIVRQQKRLIESDSSLRRASLESKKNIETYVEVESVKTYFAAEFINPGTYLRLEHTHQLEDSITVCASVQDKISKQSKMLNNIIGRVTASTNLRKCKSNTLDIMHNAENARRVSSNNQSAKLEPLLLFLAWYATKKEPQISIYEAFIVL